MLNAARARVAPSTAQHIGACMRALVTFAHKTRWLTRDLDPMWKVKYSLKANHQGEAVGFVDREALPNDEQCDALFDAMADLGGATWALAARLASRSGVRWSELIALRARDIEFAPYRRVRVERAAERTKMSEEPQFKLPKNSQRRVTIFPASLSEDLEAHVRTTRRLTGDDAVLFGTDHGSITDHRTFLRLFHDAGRAAGWPMKSGHLTVWRPHDLRHVAACWMLFDVGIEPPLVARMLGHYDVAFTLSRYVGVRTGAEAVANDLTAGW
ncbi:MAG: tyrosine-type recombinase/integrase [Actinobacteria bacterium]|nr:tyrosine-type recombinase/integrase [Actinomycetota bacterium]